MMILRAIFIVALLAVCFYGFPEMRRWRAQVALGQLTARQRLLRGWSLFCLLAALALCCQGTLLPSPHARKSHLTASETKADLRFMGCWTLAALFALPLVPLALLDARETINRVREERKEVKRKSFGADVMGPDLD